MVTISAFGHDRDVADEQVLVLSPHMDDAVWSVGSLLVDLVHGGAHVTVASVFTVLDGQVGSVGDRWLERSGLQRSSASHARREEDRTALAVVGAQSVDIGLLDAVSRCPDRYATSASLAGWDAIVAPGDPGPTQCDAAVRRLVRERSPTTVLVPLGHGRHIDHQIVSQMVIDEVRVLHYEDFPYVTLDPFVPSLGLSEGGGTSSRALEHRPSETAVERHLQAAQAYRSQVAAFYGSEAKLDTALRGHLNDDGQPRIRLVQILGADPA